MSTPVELAQQAAKLNEDQWFEFLDALDDVSRCRRVSPSLPDAPSDTSPAAVARWVAHRHFVSDKGIREIWHLTDHVPPDEIRLIEVSDSSPRPAGESSPITAVDFGLDIAGAAYRLLVADVESHQLQSLKTDPSLLPEGWSLRNASVWGRRP